MAPTKASWMGKISGTQKKINYAKATKTARTNSIGVKRSSAVANSLVRIPRYTIPVPEVKKASASYVYQNFNGVISNTTGDIVTLLPQIPHGSTQPGRIGVKTTMLKMIINGHITVNSVDYANAELLVSRLFIKQDKKNRCAETGVVTGQDKFLDAGGTAISFSGTLLDTEYPPNTDGMFFYLDKVTTIVKPYGFIAVAASALTDSGYNMIVPFTCVIEPDYKNGVPKTLQYDESISLNYPVNFNPTISLGYAYANNFPPDSTPTKLGMSWVSTLYYYDT